MDLAAAWTGYQYCQLGILFKQTRVYAIAVTVLVATSILLFFLFEPAQGARGGAAAWCGGSFAFAVVSRAVAKRIVGHRLGLGRIAGAGATIPVLLLAQRMTSTLAGDVLLWVLWMLAILGLSMLRGGLREYEVREIVRQLIDPQRTARGTDG